MGAVAAQEAHHVGPARNAAELARLQGLDVGRPDPELVGNRVDGLAAGGSRLAQTATNVARNLQATILSLDRWLRACLQHRKFRGTVRRR